MLTDNGQPGRWMSFRLRTRKSGGRRADATHAVDQSRVKMDTALRWGVSASRASSGGAMPRLGSVLLALVVVALLTIGLHVLFQ
jgi:hypothetical protein